MNNLNSMEEFEQLKNEGKHLFVFSAGWCPDCSVIETFFPEVESKFSDYTFVHVDLEEFGHLCNRLNVYGIPSLITFNNGKESGRLASKDCKTQEEVETFISRLK